ncbi:hypothetical protein CKAN_02669300 [Cinnamomum micranthum f. kanehirae]|uniref:Uncharacterized protein n=1 Tax=Cinnamomum micranthum f. kanehirae TaxID=337451 RepID=A0A3S3NDS2_9MAGN|nr:hypothetical protein CKAN_02669300 [Cinnamomum micranthum f. kanehirae]
MDKRSKRKLQEAGRTNEDFDEKRLTTLASQSHYVSVLNISDNALYGEYPPSPFASWINLISLRLTTICLLMGFFTNLRELLLSNNQISGSIPPSLGNFKQSSRTRRPFHPFYFWRLTNLLVLLLQENQLSGSIPQEIGNLNKMDQLDLSNNNLTGPIPPSLGNATGLHFLYLYGNLISGSIPQEIGGLKRIIILQFPGNFLEGPIPSTLGNLTELTKLRNGELTRLQYFYLRNNSISGYLPQMCLGVSLIEFTAINNSNNRFYGELSSSWGDCRNLTSLKFAGNNITGRIPPHIGQLTQLGILDLSSNHLEGRFPLSATSKWDKLSNLELLDLSSKFALGRNAISSREVEQVGKVKSFLTICSPVPFLLLLKE